MAKKIILLTVLFIVTTINIMAGENPTREEVWNEAVILGKKWAVPPEIIYGICEVESEYTQFNKDGKPFIYHGAIGIMQIIPKWMDFFIDRNKLQYDWRYNMEIGVRVLLEKWNMQYKSLSKNPRPNMYIPKIGDGNKMVLESWYFALWAYNCWTDRNNPNKTKDKRTYQDKVFDVIKKKFGIEISKIPSNTLEEKGLPMPGITYDYPGEKHYSTLVEEGYFDNTGALYADNNKKKVLSKYIDKYLEKLD